MDLTDTLAPKSDQLNAEDLLAGPRTVTVERVARGSVEQPVDIHLAEFPGRPFRPSKTVRRILVAAWGAEASAYTGRRMTLYRDPTVKFGGMDVGGIRVSHLSHIEKRMQIALTTTRGRRAPFVVDPLKDDPLPAPRPGATLPERIDKMLKAFEGISVTEAQIVAKLGAPTSEWGADDVAQMLTVYTSIKRGTASKDDVFPTAENGSVQ